MTTRRHTLTFEGDVPEDEMQRAAVLAHPKVRDAQAMLLEAFADAGHPHTAVSKTIKAKAAPASKPAAATAGARPRAAE